MRKSRGKVLLLMMMLVILAMVTVIPVSAAIPREPNEGGGGGGGTGSGGGGTTTSTSVGNPLTHKAYWQSSNGGREMTTNVTLQRSGALAGKVDVLTRTKNNVSMTGFTGGVFILLRNVDGAVIGVSNIQTFGVDGQWFGRYDRTDYWSWTVSPQVAEATKSVEVIQQHYGSDMNVRLAQFQRSVCGNLDLLNLPKPPFGCPA